MLPASRIVQRPRTAERGAKTLPPRADKAFVSKFQRFSALAGAAAILCAATAASADDGQHRVLSTTATISLTIAPSAVVGIRSSLRGVPQFGATANGGLPLDEVGVNYIVRDSRGDREFITARALQAALADAQRRGERDVDVTIVF